MTSPYVDKVRHLVVVLGDQLDANAASFDDFDATCDAVLMLEVEREAAFVVQHKQKLLLFFSAMRHFGEVLRERGRKVFYVELDDANNRESLGDELERWIHKARPERVLLTQPGDYRVGRELQTAARQCSCPFEIRPDRHFYSSLEEFDAFAEDRSSLVLESFYRDMRKRHQVLVKNGAPEGGRWNFDRDNRESFGKRGPGEIKAPRAFPWDDTTRAIADLVERRFPEAPGDAAGFDLPVTAEQARAALDDFVEHRLRNFGRFQDAMAAGHPFLYHSRLSTALNLHLLDPRVAVEKAVDAYRAGEAPLNSVEGFIRQILGWREFVRGVYWREMPSYERRNALDADLPMPAFMWSGETEMRCVRECVDQLIGHAYAHHIQRLMVLGLFALLLGVDPRQVNHWHLSMYADAVDWVSLPNVLGMSQYADGGLLATKPYCASGAYIRRMSDYCGECRFDPARATGENACPFTTLYWDFLSRHRNRLRHNSRLTLQFKNLDRKDPAERRALRRRADSLKSTMTEETWL